MTPPTMGPVFELPVEVGAEGSEVDVDVELLAVPVPVPVLVPELSDPLVVFVPWLLLLLVVLVLDLVDLRDPIVVGVDKMVGVSVKLTVTRLKSRGERLTAVVATVVARWEPEPQPYWKKPPSKWFR